MNYLFEANSIRDVPGELVYEFLYNKIPSVQSFDHVNIERAHKFLIELKFELVTQALSYSHDVKNTPFGPIFDTENGEGELNHVFFFKKESLLVRLCNFGENGVIGLFCSDIEVLEASYKLFQVFVEEPTENSEIGVLISTNGHIQIRKIPLDVLDLDVSANYGSEFSNVKHDLIVKKLKEEHSGLYLFYGEAGTGKTNYIKYLSRLVDRDFIFVPTNMIDSLVSPDLIQTLINNKNLVLILEDAEKAVVTREENHNEALVSTILNLTDGLIGNLFNVSIIVTFNTSKEKIDKALYRKGRLKMEHDFKALNETDSQALLNKLGKNSKAKKPMTLAEIYNVEEENFHKEPEKKTLGFQII